MNALCRTNIGGWRGAAMAALAYALLVNASARANDDDVAVAHSRGHHESYGMCGFCRPSRIVMTVHGVMRKTAEGTEYPAEILVRDVLFGPTVSVIPLQSATVPDMAEPRVYRLAQTRAAKGFQLVVGSRNDESCDFPDSELVGARVVAAEEQDTLVFCTDLVFVGDEQPPEADSPPSELTPVKLRRIVRGKGPPPGTVLRLRKSPHWDPAGQTAIYFCDRLKQNESHDSDDEVAIQDDFHFPPRTKRAEWSDYLTWDRWPIEDLARVTEWVSRHTRFPVQTRLNEQNQVTRFREITFQGTRAEALELLGSRIPAARHLAARRLIVEGEPARTDVARYVAANLLRGDGAGMADFRRLHHAIRVLSEMERQRLDGECTAHVKRILDAIASGVPFPVPQPLPEAPPQDDMLDRFTDDYSRNHSLRWLLETYANHTVGELFGARIVALRDTVPEPWRSELFDIAKTRSLDDHLEVARLPVERRSPRSLSWTATAPVEATRQFVAFSPDSSLCAVLDYGNCTVWRTNDWSVSRHLTLSRPTSTVAFSSDGKSLFLSDYAPKLGIDRWDLET